MPRAFAGRRVVVSRHEDRRDAPAGCGEALVDVEAGLGAQLDVEHQTARLRVRCGSQELFCGAKRTHAKAGGAKEELQRTQERHVIVDDRNNPHVSHGRTVRSSAVRRQSDLRRKAALRRTIYAALRVSGARSEAREEPPAPTYRGTGWLRDGSES